ncbi:DUF4386 domain-containing protein [Breoghania sp.]|uniref:DUF4386 domain-containing protein n=1 Tax=Breoghania sp. TaxID=2065378 RepID=UPI00261E6879|nr:DUF4386 domain-containing protein [Breoghania sp.]MDJ0930670.1 DUF4386 domain-containing protein [Breoghania sp.]
MKTFTLGIARLAGLLYLVIIGCDIGAKLGLRGPLIDLADAQATRAAILDAPIRFRAALTADMVMVAADIGLAVLLYTLFRPVGSGLALAAMVFRLMQTALIGASLLFMQAVWLIVSQSANVASPVIGDPAAFATFLLDMHAHGYDLGLAFFSVNCMLTGILIRRSGFFPKLLGTTIALAGGVYLIGSALRFFTPQALNTFGAFYVVSLIAETAFCLWLLFARNSARLANQVERTPS